MLGKTVDPGYSHVVDAIKKSGASTSGFHDFHYLVGSSNNLCSSLSV